MRIRTAACCAFLILLLWLSGCQRVSKAANRYLYDPSRAKPADVSLNKLHLAEPDAAAYRFLVIGHGYGSTTVDDHLPDPALLARIPDLEEMNLSMLVSLGDIVQHATPEDFNNLERVLLAPLPFPVFNTPGNHDVVKLSRGRLKIRKSSIFSSSCTKRCSLPTSGWPKSTRSKGCRT